MKKTLIAYYSRAGANYDGYDDVVELPVGNTEIIAGIIRDQTGGDVFQIRTATPYPDGYTETTEISKKELQVKARPRLADSIDGMDGYSIIFLGYPNWWGTMPMAVFSFLESGDFANKIIIPFCTHEGSEMGRSEDDIRTACPETRVETGLAIRGSHVNRAEGEVAAWIQGLRKGGIPIPSVRG